MISTTVMVRLKNIKSLSDDEILELANNLRTGVPMATPVFDGIKEEDIKSLLKMADLPESGQIKLFDGRTGEAFDRDMYRWFYAYVETQPPGG